MPSTGKQRTIDAPQLLTGRQRVRDTAITGLMWIFYAYLWLPAVSLAAWLLGIDFAYEVMVRAGGAEGLRTILGWYGLALLGMIVLVTAWSAAERLRFRGKQRRHFVTPVEDAAIAASFGVDATQLRTLRHANCLRLAFETDGRLRSLRSGAIERRTA